MTEWQPIETAPKVQSGRTRGPEILVTNCDAIYVAFWNGRSWDDGDFFDDIGVMTHWMHLPSLPKKALQIELDARSYREAQNNG